MPRLTRRVVPIVMAVACFGFGGWMIYRHVFLDVPDPRHADADRLVSFVMSDRFRELSAEDRRAFSEALVDRYATMDAEQRDRVEDRVNAFRKENPDRVREQMIVFWKDYVVSEAERYLEVPPAEREAHLEERLAWLENQFGDGDSDRRRGDNARERRERWDEMLTPERQARVTGFFRDEVWPRTSAKDRAMVSVFMSDAAKAMR